jgi:catechol 2,3-dioxygenase
VAHVDEPIYDVAHLSHIELLTPRPEESQRFFTDVLYLQVVGRQGQSVYLRGYGDWVLGIRRAQAQHPTPNT